jgi:hypothetical protein
MKSEGWAVPFIVYTKITRLEWWDDSWKFSKKCVYIGLDYTDV